MVVAARLLDVNHSGLRCCCHWRLIGWWRWLIRAPWWYEWRECPDREGPYPRCDEMCGLEVGRQNESVAAPIELFVVEW